MSEYVVEGYGAAARNPEYDGPYLDGYDFDPAINFKFAGDPEKQAQLQEVLADTEGTPVIGPAGSVQIITGPGEPNVVILDKEPDDVNTVVLDKTRVDEIGEEMAKQDLLSVQGNREGAGAPSGTVDTEQDSSAKDEVPLYTTNPEGDTHEDIDLDGESGKDETRDGESYNPTEGVFRTSETVKTQNDDEDKTPQDKAAERSDEPGGHKGNVTLS